MKNKSIAILIAILVLLNCTPIYANTFIGSDTIDEIKDIEDVIVEDINSYSESQEFTPIDSDDIDYSKIYRVYDSKGILDNEKLDNETMQKFIENKEYGYILDVFHNEKTIDMTIDSYKELSNEEKENLSPDIVEKIENKIGEWNISSIGFLQGEQDYLEILEKKLAENQIVNANVYFVNRISKSIGMTAIVCPDNGEEAKLIIQNDDTLYTFDEIKAIAEQDAEELKNLPEGTYGDDATPIQTSVDAAAPTPDNSKIIIVSAISGVAVLAIAIAAICIVKKKKHTKVNNEE